MGQGKTTPVFNGEVDDAEVDDAEEEIRKLDNKIEETLAMLGDMIRFLRV